MTRKQNRIIGNIMGWNIRVTRCDARLIFTVSKPQSRAFWYTFDSGAKRWLHLAPDTYFAEALLSLVRM